MTPDVDPFQINATLRDAAQKGVTKVLTFEVRYTPGGYTLRLVLGLEDQPRLALICYDVQDLELNPTGDGFDKVARLQVNDMREDRLNRIHFSLEEMERETIFLHCGSLAIEPVG